MAVFYEVTARRLPRFASSTECPYNIQVRPVAAYIYWGEADGYSLAVNSQFDPMIASVSNLPPEVRDKLHVIGEQRTIELQNGAFRDRFQPYEVHLYAPAS